MSPSPASERRDQRPAGSLPARMSPSALKKYDTCPRSYYYRYILKLPDPTGLPAIQGTVAHAILEELMQKPREERTVEWCHDQVERVWRDEYLQALQKGNPPLVKWEAWLTDAIASGELELTDEQLAITDEQFSDEQTEAHVFSLIRMFLDNAFKIERLTNFDPHATEIKLIKDIAGVPLLGIVDRLDRFESNGREYFAVSDYKTGRPTEQDAPWLYRDMFAMRVYALLVQEEFGVTPYQLRLLFLRCDDKEDGVVTLNVDEQMLEKTRIEVKRLYREIRTSHRRNDWPVMKKLNEKFCVHCPYYVDICPAWNEDMPPLEEEQEMKQPDDRVA